QLITNDSGKQFLGEQMLLGSKCHWGASVAGANIWGANVVGATDWGASCVLPWVRFP
ncbi:unnamed protein product, partial [Rotaria socialis]